MSASRNGYIGRAPADSSVIIARKTHEPTGVQTDFTFNSGYTPGYCDVYMNGVKLIDEKDFTATNGSTVGLTSAAQSGDIIELVAYKAFNLGVPLADITGNLDITGYVSASSSITAGGSFYGDGSNLSGVAGAAITQYVSANSLTVLGSPGVSTITRLGATDLNVTGIITANGLSGNVTGSACTFTTGTFNGNVTIGGTLTYEDVTNVDSLGIVTARAGVNISGGELLVGSNIKGGTAGVLTATSFSGSGANLTSLPTQTPTTITVADESSDTTCFPSFFTAATGDLAPKTGTNLTFNSSTGALTATSFVGDGSNLTGISGAVAGTTGDFSSNLTVGSGITFGSAGVATISGTGDLHLTDGVQLKMGDSSDFQLYHDGTKSIIKNTTGALILHGASVLIKNEINNEVGFSFTEDGTVELHYNDSKKIETTNDGTVTTGIATATGGLAINADSKNLTIGAGEDLKLYHNGTNSVITNATGDLYINNNADTIIKPANDLFIKPQDGENGLSVIGNGAVEAYYDNVKKFETTNDGVVITGITTSDGLRMGDDERIKLGNSEDLSIYHHTSHDSYVSNATGFLSLRSTEDVRLMSDSNEFMVKAIVDGAVEVYYDNSKKWETTNDGTVTTGIATVTQGLNTDGLLSEKFNTTAGKLSDNTNIDLEDGMVHYFSTQETTTSTPNIRYSSSKSLNNMLSIGDAITVTIITTAAAAGYSANVSIDSGSRTEEWVGGSAPSEGGSDGLDIYTYNILKTGNGAYQVIVNVLNATN